jgi:hypothetical protein
MTSHYITCHFLVNSDGLDVGGFLFSHYQNVWIIILSVLSMCTTVCVCVCISQVTSRSKFTSNQTVYNKKKPARRVVVVLCLGVSCAANLPLSVHVVHFRVGAISSAGLICICMQTHTTVGAWCIHIQNTQPAASIIFRAAFSTQTKP